MKWLFSQDCKVRLVPSSRDIRGWIARILGTILGWELELQHIATLLFLFLLSVPMLLDTRVKIQSSLHFKISWILADLHIGQIKGTIGPWPWTSTGLRSTDTASARLRVGHAELNAYLNRFGQRDSPMCPGCRVPETIRHYILECRNYEDSRRTLVTNLRREGVVEITLKTILGGGNYNRDTQDRISTALKRYLLETRRMYGTM